MRVCGASPCFPVLLKAIGTRLTEQAAVFSAVTQDTNVFASVKVTLLQVRENHLRLASAKMDIYWKAISEHLVCGPPYCSLFHFFILSLSLYRQVSPALSELNGPG